MKNLDHYYGTDKERSFLRYAYNSGAGGMETWKNMAYGDKLELYNKWIEVRNTPAVSNLKTPDK